MSSCTDTLRKFKADALVSCRDMKVRPPLGQNLDDTELQAGVKKGTICTMPEGADNSQER